MGNDHPIGLSMNVPSEQPANGKGGWSAGTKGGDAPKGGRGEMIGFTFNCGESNQPQGDNVGDTGSVSNSKKLESKPRTLLACLQA